MLKRVKVLACLVFGFREFGEERILTKVDTMLAFMFILVAA